MTAAARSLAGLVAATVTLASLAADDMTEPPAEERWHVVESSSRVQFWVRIFGIVPLAGEFARVAGAIVVDPAAATARVEADVPATSVTMQRDSHTRWARSPEFFDAEQYPTIRFESDPFPLTRLESGGAIQGRLTVRGTTRAVGFSIERAQCVGLRHADARARRCRVELAGAIDRSQFGMRTRGGTLGNRVSLRFHIDARPAR